MITTVFLLSLACTSLSASTYTVTTTADDRFSPPEGSLREAVNNAVTEDVISFDLTYPAAISLDVYELDIYSGMTIQGLEQISFPL